MLLLSKHVRFDLYIISQCHDSGMLSDCLQN